MIDVMENWMMYIFKSSVCLTLLYLPFWGFLRKDTFFRFNRYALLGITFFSFLLPSIRIPELAARIMEQNLFNIQLEEISITIQGGVDLMSALSVLYWIGVLACFAYKAFEFVNLIRFIPKGCLWVSHEDGVHIHCHAHEILSFSWMNHIVISQKDYEENAREILAHERAHISMGHSWDVLWLSVVEIFQWFNPFVWMLSREMQDIHEYEADMSVLRQGINLKDYQSLIIKKAIGSSYYAFANSFNHSSLKKRFTMMLKVKSSPWAHMKYLYLLPVSAFCIIACTQNLSSMEGCEETSSAVASEELLPFVEEMPKFPGGMHELIMFLNKNIVYPDISIKNDVQGRVMVQFVITKEGYIKDPNVLSGVDPHLDAEALRVVRSMPRWKPGKLGGEPANVKYTLPIMFRLK